MLTCHLIKAQLESVIPSLFSCEEGEGFVTLKTPFFYPDGDRIELFLKPKADRILVTDFGETLRYLNGYGFEMKNSRNRLELFDDALKALGITHFRGALYASVADPSEIPEASMRLAQAITRVCDLLYTARARTPALFKDEVRELLEWHRFDIEEDYIVVGGSQRVYEVDFAVRVKSSIRLVKLVSPSSVSSTRAVIDRVICMWFDISQVVQERDCRISLLDDLSVTWKPEDMRLFSLASRVFTWSDRDSFIQNLRAA